MAAETKKKKGIDITVWLLISMIAAVVVGLVVGEPMKNVQFIGDIFFRLIQMTIPIFILCTIVKSVGGLTPQTLSGIGLKGIIVFIVTTGIAAAIGVSLPCSLVPVSRTPRLLPTPALTARRPL